MKLAPGAPLAASLTFDNAAAPMPVGRLAMDTGLAQLEWSNEAIAAALPVSGLLYPPEPGLHPARGREFEGLHGFLSDSLPEGWGYLVMRRRLAKLGLQIDALSPLDRLALVGDQGRGALTYLPATAPPPDNVFGRHYNEAFSSLSIADYKSFLRMHIHAEGKLTIYPFRIHRVPRSWMQQPGQTPAWAPAGGSMKVELIEEPITVGRGG